MGRQLDSLEGFSYLILISVFQLMLEQIYQITLISRSQSINFDVNKLMNSIVF